MWVGVPHSPQLILNTMEQRIKELLNNIVCHKISIGDGIEEIKKLFSEYTHPVMNYNKEDYHSKDKRILAGDVAQELNVVVGEIGWPTCGATMKGGFVENKCPFCDQPYFK